MSVFKSSVVVMAFLCVGAGSVRATNSTCLPADKPPKARCCVPFASVSQLSSRYLNLATPEGRKVCTVFLGLDLLTVAALFKWQHATQAKGRQIPPVPMAIQLAWLQMILRYFCLGVNTTHSIGT